MELEELPAQLSRRNWVVLAFLLVLSLPFAHWPFSLGVLCGGLLAIGAFHWMRRSLQQLLAEASRFGFHFSYFLRLLVLGILIALLLAVVKIHPIGLLVGLSVVVINLLWLTVQRTMM